MGVNIIIKIRFLLKTIIIFAITIFFVAPGSTVVNNRMRSVFLNQENNDYQNLGEINCDWPMHEGWPYELGGGQFIQSVAEDGSLGPDEELHPKYQNTHSASSYNFNSTMSIRSLVINAFCFITRM